MDFSLIKYTHITALLIGFSLTITPCQANDAASIAYIETEMFGYSETAPIAQIVLDDFEGAEFDGGTRSFTHNRWESGVVHNGIKFALIARYDYVLDYSEDLAELVYREKNDLPIQTNRAYEVYIDALYARTAGLKLGYEIQPQPGLFLGVDVSALQVSDFLDGTIKGNVLVGDDSYIGEIGLDYVYTKDKLLDRIAEKPSGRGYAVDLAMKFQASDNLDLSMEVKDLTSRLKFERAPFTTARASSDRISLNPDGTIDVKPILRGRESYRKHTMALPRRITFDALYRIDSNNKIFLGTLRHSSDTYTHLGWSRKLNERWEFSPSFNFGMDALTLALSSRNLGVSLTSDRADFDEARTFGLSFSYQLVF